VAFIVFKQNFVGAAPVSPLWFYFGFDNPADPLGIEPFQLAHGRTSNDHAEKG
jgi:hypothetical protein